MKRDISISKVVFIGLIVMFVTHSIFSAPLLKIKAIGEAIDSSSKRINTSGVELSGRGVGCVKKDDGILFCYSKINGNFDIDVYISTINGIVGSTESGIMIRTDTTPSASFLSLIINYESGMLIKYRTDNGKNLKTVELSKNIDTYLRIRRNGNTFIVYSRPNSLSSWVQRGSYSLSWISTLYSGVFLSSGSIDKSAYMRTEYINGLPEEPKGKSACTPLLYDFERDTSLTLLGFREVNKWVIDTGKYIRTVIPLDSCGIAHLLTPQLVIPLTGADTFTFSFNFRFRGDTVPYLFDYGLFSVEQISLNDRAKINATHIGSASKIIAGLDDTLYTSFYCSDSVIIKDRSKVYGNVTTSKVCRLINGAAVYGTIYENALYSPPSIPTMQVDTGTTSITVNAGDSLNLTPGNYSSLIVYAGGKIRLTPGVYRFSRITFEPDVKIYTVNSGLSRITVLAKNKLQFSDRVKMILRGDTLALPNILFYSSQTTQLDIGADIRLYGYYVVPNAEVRVVSRGIIIDGGIYAKRITFEPDVKITVNGFLGRTNQLITTFIPLRSSKPIYSVNFITHRGIMQKTMQDVLLKKDNQTFLTASTGENTPFNLWLSLLVKIFKVDNLTKMRVFYNKGSGFYQIIDTIIQSPDTLSSIAFDYKKEDIFGPVTANLDNISISCAADTCPAVTIIYQPTSQYVYEGEAATFSCYAEAGYTTPQYQWYRNGVAIPWATLSSYTIPYVTKEDSGSFFFCKIYGPCGEATTDTAELIVYQCTTPTFSAQPLNDTVYLDSPAVFVAVAQGPSISYQWLRNGEPIRGADDSVYIIPSVKHYNNRDLYSVKITNRCGMISVSREALLVIKDVTPCKIIKQPLGDTLIEGDFYHTEVTVSCKNGEVVWYKNGQKLNGANGTSLIYGPVSLTDNGAEFFCIVSNGVTSDTSKKVYIIVRSLASYGGAIAISGELYNYYKEKVGIGNGEWFDFMVKLYSTKIGGTPLYIEKFRVKKGRGVFVKNGEFTLTLGRGEANTNLQSVVVVNKELYAEIYAGKEGSFEIIAPRLRLTAAPYAFSSGVKVIYGEGNPTDLTLPVGTMYVDRDNNSTWKLGRKGWVKLD